MSPQIHIGCCGWSYLNGKEFSSQLKEKPVSKLWAYAQLFDDVEVNSTFYRLPRLTTAQKWRLEADEANPKFQFTVKAFQGITHLHRFQKKDSIVSFDTVTEVAEVLHARFILFQSPASFKPSERNIENMKWFFDRIDRNGMIAVWEPRGKWYDEPVLIEKVCVDCKLVHCVDPFRYDPLVFGDSTTAYFRLHGFGKPSMYRYDFSHEELIELRSKINSIQTRLNDVFVFFNNEKCYDNGRTFRQLMDTPETLNPSCCANRSAL